MGGQQKIKIVRTKIVFDLIGPTEKTTCHFCKAFPEKAAHST